MDGGTQFPEILCSPQATIRLATGTVQPSTKFPLLYNAWAMPIAALVRSKGRSTSRIPWSSSSRALARSGTDVPLSCDRIKPVLRVGIGKGGGGEDGKRSIGLSGG